MATNDVTDPAAASDGRPARQLPESKEQVRARREELRSALVALENVLSSPAGGRDPWVGRVESTVRLMQSTLEAHVEDTEAEDGMLAQIDEDAPGLQGRVEQLRGEHGHLLEQTRALLERCRQGQVEEVRDAALDLLQTVSRHRQRGTDLLWDAYMVDISAAD